MNLRVFLLTLPGRVHQATISPSVSPTTESGSGGAQSWKDTVKSSQSLVQLEELVQSTLTQKSSILLTKPVWHNDSGPSVVALHSY